MTRDLNINYVADESLLTHPYAFPAHGNLAGLPPTLVVNADVDDLRPSGEAYAAALVTAGVDVTVNREVGSDHGHLIEPTNPVALDPPGPASTRRDQGTPGRYQPSGTAASAGRRLSKAFVSQYLHAVERAVR